MFIRNVLVVAYIMFGLPLQAEEPFDNDGNHIIIHEPTSLPISPTALTDVEISDGSFVFKTVEPTERVESSSLAEIPLDSLHVSHESFEPIMHLWDSFDENGIWKTLNELKPLSSSPLLHQLKYRLVANGIMISSTSPEDHSLFDLRVRLLGWMGEHQAASSLLKSVPPNRDDSSIQQLRVESLLWQARYDDACDITIIEHAKNINAPFWQHAFILCSLKDKDQPTLIKSLERYRENLPNGLFGLIMARALKPNEQAKPTKITAELAHNPLALAFAHIGNVPVKPENISSFPPSALSLLITSLDSHTDIRAQAGELLLATGKFLPSTLGLLYKNVAIPKKYLKTKRRSPYKAEQIEARALAYHRMIDTSSIDEKLTAINAMYKAFEKAGLTWAGYRFINNNASDFEMESPIPANILPATATLFRTLLLHQKDIQANDWMQLLAQQPIVGPIAHDIAKLRIGAQAIQQPEGKELTNMEITIWQQLAASIKEEEQQSYLQFIYELLSALDTKVPETELERVKNPDATGTTSLVKGVSESYSTTYPGKTISLVIELLEDPLSTDFPKQSIDIIDVFYHMGLKAEALELARMAIVYASQNEL